MTTVIGGILVLRLHAFLALFAGALVVALLTPSAALRDYAYATSESEAVAEQLVEKSAGERIAGGFGKTTGQVGIVIAMASIIGICLLESGSADHLVRAALKVFGEKRAPLAFLGSGFFLAVPVFFDTVFYLMVPLAKASRLRTGRNYLFYILAVVAGGTMAHSLVPPTPGPLFVAERFDVDLGLMIIGGGTIGFLAAASGFLFAGWANRKWELPLRESEESLKQLETVANMDEKNLPPVWLAAFPILLPVVLISARTFWQSWGLRTDGGIFWAVLSVVGDKNIALTAAAAVALLTLLAKRGGRQTSEAVKKGLTTAGVIILIIGAGGAFGNALQQTGIGNAIKDLSSAYQISLLPLAFVLTALVRTAQGSATVAMITAAGAFSGLADAAVLGFHPFYLAAVIGCGSKPIWWMNDSGFWVVSQMSGMTAKEGLRMLTPLTLIMGLVGLIATLLGAYFFPLV